VAAGSTAPAIISKKQQSPSQKATTVSPHHPLHSLSDSFTAPPPTDQQVKQQKATALIHNAISVPKTLESLIQAVYNKKLRLSTIQAVFNKHGSQLRFRQQTVNLLLPYILLLPCWIATICNRRPMTHQQQQQ